MAETYDETAELDNARSMLLMPTDQAAHPTVVSSETQRTGTHTDVAFGFSDEVALSDSAEDPRFLVPMTHTATMPVDDELLNTQTQSESEGGEDLYEEVPQPIDVETDALDTTNDEEPIGADNTQDTTRSRRRVEETTVPAGIVEKEYDADFVNEILGLGKVDAEADDLDENISLLAHFSNLAERFPAAPSHLDLASIFHASRVKKLFRAGWGDGGETKLDFESGDECPLVSSEAVVAISHAAALFVDDLVKQSAEQTRRRGKKTVSYDDIAVTVSTLDRFSFLSEIAPPEQTPLPHVGTRGNNAPNTRKAIEREKTNEPLPGRQQKKTQITEMEKNKNTRPSTAAAAKHDISAFFKRQ